MNMNRRFKSVQRRIAAPAYRQAFERLDAALANARQRNQADWDLAEDEKLKRARLALFGCAAK